MILMRHRNQRAGPSWRPVMSRKMANMGAKATALRHWECGVERREEDAAEQRKWKREIIHQSRL